jgi:hypothetical protein
LEIEFAVSQLWGSGDARAVMHGWCMMDSHADTVADFLVRQLNSMRGILTFWSANWLNKHLPKNVRALERGEWPPYSPDLNPIETLWTHLENKVIADECETVEELTEAMIDEWWKFEQSTLQHLIVAVPKNIERCYNNNAGRFEKH